MEREPIEVLNLQSNAAIVRCPGRRFPGVVVQGDTLHSLYATAASLAARLRESGANQDNAADARELATHLGELLLHYQSVMEERSLELPYATAVTTAELELHEPSSCEDALPELARCRGRWAQVWDYSASHSTIRITLTDVATGSFALLSLHGCDRVSFRPSWQRAAIAALKGADHVEVTDGLNLQARCLLAHLSRELRDHSEIPTGPLDHV